MKASRRLEERARGVARAARDAARKVSAPPGIEAVYARNLDGDHLWLAVPADAGEPALRIRTTGEIVDPGSDLPPTTEAENGVRSVRWPLAAALPATDGAVADVVVRAEREGQPAPVLVPPARPSGSARNPTTSDNRWRFVLDGGPGEALSVRRTAVPQSPRLLDIRIEENVVTLRCGGAPAGAELLLIREPGSTTWAIAGSHTDAGFEARLTEADLPSGPGDYHVHLGTTDDHLPVLRRQTDIRVRQATDVLLPALTDEAGDREVVRFRFAAGGALRVQRLNGSDSAQVHTSGPSSDLEEA